VFAAGAEPSFEGGVGDEAFLQYLPFCKARALPMSPGAVDVDVVTGPVGLTMRADASPTLPIQIIRDAIRAVAVEIGLTSQDRPLSPTG
jgi:hypothetical protein